MADVELSTALVESVTERLKAYIHPNVAQSEEQETAFQKAVQYQAEYEASHADALDIAQRGVQSFSSGNYSETYFTRQSGEYAASTLCPASYAVLFNAGLLRRDMPVARRL